MNKKVTLITPESKEEFGFEHSLISYSSNDIVKASSDEIKAYEILNQQASIIKHTDSFLISHSCRSQDAKNFILYLRMIPEWHAQHKIVVWLSSKTYAEVASEDDSKENILEDKNTFFIYKYDFDRQIDLLEKIKNIVVEMNADTSTSPITVHPPRSSSHQITNEWAAYKLAYDAGLSNILSELEKKPYAKTLYFKYLKQKINYSIPSQNTFSSSSLAFGKYLLIDDNYQKGWYLVFERILQAQGIILDNFDEVDQMEIDEYGTIELIKNKIQQEKYKGILLDLRLTQKDDTKEKENVKVSEFTGGKILKKLKSKFPHVPIIITTASDKAWNMRQLLDNGADGYYIKENPEYFPSEEVSRNNYNAFVKTIKNCKKKHKNLAPFWERINDINTTSTLIEEKVVNGLQTRVEERVRERLMMFFGLLKRQYENSSYNKKFYYSDLKLAFMTLWSCLNDLQYIYLEIRKISNVDNEMKIRNLSNVAIQADRIYLTKKLMDHEKTDKYSLETKIKETKTKFKIRDDWKNTKDLSRSIGHQIAMIINALSNNDSKRDFLLKNLKTLKTKRNKLYLTHGDDASQSSFYQNLEKDNDNIRLQDCADLFEIVYFLLKGIYVKIEV